VRAGDFVLKPVENPARYEWACERLAALKPRTYRIAAPLQDANGRYVFRGWGATRFEPGEPEAGRWGEKLFVSRTFHADLNQIAYPPMPPGHDRWTRAHEIAWQEADLPAGLHPDLVGSLERLFGHYSPLARAEAIIHADLCGNILFHPGLPPCLIDFSPAYGSPTYADAILVADAVAWEGAPLSLVEQLPFDENARQHLLRAVAFRLMTAALFAPGDVGFFMGEFAEFQPLVELLT
jgi:hypothetical protein